MDRLLLVEGRRQSGDGPVESRLLMEKERLEAEESPSKSLWEGIGEEGMLEGATEEAAASSSPKDSISESGLTSAGLTPCCADTRVGV